MHFRGTAELDSGGLARSGMRFATLAVAACLACSYARAQTPGTKSCDFDVERSGDALVCRIEPGSGFLSVTEVDVYDVEWEVPCSEGAVDIQIGLGVPEGRTLRTGARETLDFNSAPRLLPVGFAVDIVITNLNDMCGVKGKIGVAYTENPVATPPPASSPPTPVPQTPEPPTTPEPSSVAPQTAAPSSRAPATAAPTLAPSTGTPSTTAPTSQAPASPATRMPSSILPSTVQPPASPAPATTKEPPTPGPSTSRPAALPSTLRPPTPSLSPQTPTPAGTTAPSLPQPPSPIAPATTAPRTAGPPTRSTSTPATTTAAPAADPRTLVPFTPIQGLKRVERKEISDANTVGAAGGIVAALASGAGVAGNAGKLAILKNFGCEVEDVDVGDGEPLDWELHPVGAPFGSGPLMYKTAAVVLNPLLLLAFFLLFFLVAALARATCYTSWESAFAYTRLPGLIYIPYLFLLQGTSLIAGQLAFFPATAGTNAILGWIVLLLCCVSPALLHRSVLSRIDERAALICDPKVTLLELPTCSASDSEATTPETLSGWKRMLYVFTFGDSLWVSTDGSYFCECYGVVFETMKPGCMWFVLYELGNALLLSMLSAWKPSSSGECDARNIVITIQCFAVFALVVYFRPYIPLLENIIAGVVAFMMFLAVLLLTIAIAIEASESSSVRVVAMWNLVTSAYVVAAKALWDVCGYIYEMLEGRMKKNRAAARLVAYHKERDVGPADAHGKRVSLAEVHETYHDGSYMTMPASPLVPMSERSASFADADTLADPLLDLDTAPKYAVGDNADLSVLSPLTPRRGGPPRSPSVFVASKHRMQRPPGKGPPFVSTPTARLSSPLSDFRGSFQDASRAAPPPYGEPGTPCPDNPHVVLQLQL